MYMSLYNVMYMSLYMFIILVILIPNPEVMYSPGRAAPYTKDNTSTLPSHDPKLVTLKISNKYVLNLQVNPAVTIFTAFVHQQKGSLATGCYAVAWEDYWGHRSRPGNAACVTDAGPAAFTNF